MLEVRSHCALPPPAGSAGPGAPQGAVSPWLPGRTAAQIQLAVKELHKDSQVPGNINLQTRGKKQSMHEGAATLKPMYTYIT